MNETRPRISEMPRLYDLFDMPKLMSVRSATVLHSKINFKDVLKVPHTRVIKASNKEIIKFELKRGNYLLLFPSSYVEVHAPDEGSVREILLAFRDELFKNGLIG